MAGRYRIIERIGSGGTGEVYRAIDEQTQTSVAIKLLRSGISRDLEHTTRLFEGAWTANHIRHENIVVIYETGLCDLGPFIVMEDLRGENVGKLLERHGRLKLPYAFAVIEPVLSALAAAHAVGHLHGDVKPENVVVCQLANLRVTVKLLDFGAAGTLSSNSSVFGTTEYLSPEQASSGSIDHRSDLFSACVLFYELLTNTRPFHGPTASSTAYRIVNLRCPSLSESGLLHHGSVWNVLRRGLEKNPADRYQSSRELLDSLRSVAFSDIPSGSLLNELLPPAALKRTDSSSLPAASGVNMRVASAVPVGPESGSRLATTVRNTLRPTANGAAESARQSGSIPPSSSDRENMGPVLPARYRGRYKVRAVVWQALDEYVRARRPANLRERLLTDLATEEASDLLLGTLQGIVYADLDTITLFVELATGRMFSGDVSWCRAAGRESVDGILATALSRSIPPALNVLVTLRRVCRIAAPLFDFGEWQAIEGADAKHATLSVTGMDPVCLGLRLFCVGLVERSLTVVHSGISVNITRGDGPFMPRLVLDVSTG